MTKWCHRCRQDVPVDNYYRRRGGTGTSPYCIPCMKDQALVRQRALKLQAIRYKGAKCQRCGYDRCVGALEFHHRDPSGKDFSLGHTKNTNFEKVRAELDKCDLLCANCHREIHAAIKGNS